MMFHLCRDKNPEMAVAPPPALAIQSLCQSNAHLPALHDTAAMPFTRSARKNANQDMVLAWPLLPRCCGCPVNVAQEGEYPPMAAVLNSVSLDPLPDQARRGTWSTWPFRAPNLLVLQRHSYLHK